MKKHPLFHTLIHLKGNPRVCVYTEPLWGIPFNLYIPFFSVYMLALGINDQQIGLITTVGFISQIVFSLFGGIITDKYGRKNTTFVFDILSWSIPCLIWAFSSSFTHFIIAALINGMFRVTANSWVCLLVEDADKDNLVSIYSWVFIAGLIAAFFTPITGLILNHYDLITTMRALLILSFVMMTSKFIILQIVAKETAVGKQRMEETKHISLNVLFRGYKDIIIKLLKTPETLFVMTLMVILSIVNMINSTFWSIMVTEHIELPTNYIAYVPFIRSSIMMIFFFAIVPKINARKFKLPLSVGFFSFLISQIILILTPNISTSSITVILMLIIGIILEACALSLINPLMESLQVILVDVKERARIISLIFVAVLAITSPFGYIAGLLSSIDRRLPFALNIGLIMIGILLVMISNHNKTTNSNNLSRI